MQHRSVVVPHFVRYLAKTTMTELKRDPAQIVHTRTMHEEVATSNFHLPHFCAVPCQNDDDRVKVVIVHTRTMHKEVATGNFHRTKLGTRTRGYRTYERDDGCCTPFYPSITRVNTGMVVGNWRQNKIYPP